MANGFAILGAFALMACSSSSSPPPPTPGSASGSAPAKPAGPRSSLDVSLPPLSGKPIAKTTKPLTKQQLDTLANTELGADFTRDVRGLTDEFFTVKYKTELRPWLVITLTVGHCKDCVPINDLARWRNNEPLISSTLSPKLRELPDTVFEVGPTTIGGGPAIYVYHVGLLRNRDENNNPIEWYSNAYTLHYNDGVNRMRIVVDYADHPTDKREELVTKMPRAFLERVAVAVADTVGQRWGN